MKKILLLSFVLMGMASMSNAQITIFEDFDSYAVGSDIVQVNPTYFEYWPGGNMGLEVSDAQAFSGNNSIYLYSANGAGPDDVIMTFKDKYETGTASLSFQMYVSPGHGAYYNVQAEETAGVTWASQVYFNTNGTVEFQNSDQTVAASALFNHGEWFEVRYDVNLDANIWELSLDGVCVASYSNNANSFASFNLYPASLGGVPAEYWFDDMRFEHNPESAELGRDISLAPGDEVLVGFENNTFTNAAVLINNLGETVTSAEIEIEYPGSNQTFTLDNLEVEVGDSLQIIAPTPITIVSGVSELVVILNSVNGIVGDDSGCNNKLFTAVTAVTPTPRKGVLAEEATGTWCPQCPRGAVTMELMEERYGEFFVGIAVHNNDPMVLSEYEAVWNTIPGFGGYPNVSVNRGTAFVPGNSIISVEAPFIEAVTDPIRSAFEIGASLDDATNEVDITIEVEAVGILNFGDKMVVAIVEDHVTGTDPGYAQANALSGTDIPYGGYNVLPNPVPADMMQYDDVARALLTSVNGDNLGLASSISGGEKRVYSYKITLDDSWDKDNLLITAFVLSGSGAVDNAKETKLNDAIAAGLSSDVNDVVLQSSFKIYPNPVADLMNVQLESESAGDVQLELFNIYGQLVYSKKLESFVGKQNWLVNVSELANGTYAARVRIGDKTAMQKVQKFTK